jgi:hypothetical protein
LFYQEDFSFSSLSAFIVQSVFEEIVGRDHPPWASWLLICLTDFVTSSITQAMYQGVIPFFKKTQLARLRDIVTSCLDHSNLDCSYGLNIFAHTRTLC